MTKQIKKDVLDLSLLAEMAETTILINRAVDTLQDYFKSSEKGEVVLVDTPKNRQYVCQYCLEKGEER